MQPSLMDPYLLAAGAGLVFAVVIDLLFLKRFLPRWILWSVVGVAVSLYMIHLNAPRLSFFYMVFAAVSGGLLGLILSVRSLVTDQLATDPES